MQSVSLITHVAAANATDIIQQLSLVDAGPCRGANSSRPRCGARHRTVAAVASIAGWSCSMLPHVLQLGTFFSKEVTPRPPVLAALSRVENVLHFFHKKRIISILTQNLGIYRTVLKIG